MKNTLAVLLGFLFIFCHSALASNFYTDISIGVTNYPSTEVLDDEVSVKEGSDPISFSIIGGYSVNQYFSLEMAYSWLGEYDVEYEINSVAQSDAPNAAMSFDTNTFILALVPSYPINNRWGVFAKLGYHWWDVDYETRSVLFEDGFFVGFENQSGSESDSGSVLGFGCSIAFTKSITGKAMINRLKFPGDSVDNYSLSVGYLF